jgi:hypothetical protein
MSKVGATMQNTKYVTDFINSINSIQIILIVPD